MIPFQGPNGDLGVRFRSRQMDRDGPDAVHLFGEVRREVLLDAKITILSRITTLLVIILD